jgi:N-acetylglucosamine-6-sulfatase
VASEPAKYSCDQLSPVSTNRELDMRTLLAAATLLLTASVAQAAKPNFVVIMTDDMPVPMLQAMPLTRQLVGNMGIEFRQSFVEDSLCCPSRATFLTGLYTHNHGVLHNDNVTGGAAEFRRQGSENDTVATRLQAAGYRTALIGRYLNGYEYLKLSYIPPGWSYWFGTAENEFKTFYNYAANDNGVIRRYGSTAADYGTDVVAGKAVDFIRSSAGKPFFLYLPVGAPHEPMVPAPRHKTLPMPGVPRTPAFNEADVSDKPDFLQYPLLTASQVATKDARYRNAMRTLVAVDEAIKRIHDTLRDTGRLANTYIIFTSDHGMHFGERRIPEGKQLHYEHDIRTPLLVRGPGITAGRVDATNMVVNVDLAPTILHLAGVAWGNMDGRSFRPLLLGITPVTPWRTAFPLARWRQDKPFKPTGQQTWWHSFRGVRTATHKWIEWADGSRELYDLVVDPFELNNLATNDEATPNAAEGLAALAGELAECVGARCREVERQGN